VERLTRLRASAPTASARTARLAGRTALPVMLALAGVTTALAYVSVPPASATPTSTVKNCSWGFRSGADTVNVAYPDTSANYWAYTYTAVPGTELVIRGTYPRARYFSFVVYQDDAAPIASIYDAEIQPDAGSGNPFVGPVAKDKPEKYTVTVLFTAPPSQPAPNTLYAGESTVDGTPNPAGTLMLRTYVPQHESSPQGSVPFPTVTWQTTSGTVLSAGAACASALPANDDVIAQELNSQSFPVELSSGSSTAVTWSRTASTGVGYPNPQNAYLSATISREEGDLVVVHALAPTFPNTSKGVPVYTPSQLRYWSICVNSETTQVISCVPDYRSPLVDGYYTYVISDPSVRPKNATARNGVAWLPWGSTDLESVLILRNMLPAATFTQAAQNVSTASGSPSAEQVMGPYYPEAVYCAPSTFQAGGWRACFAAAGV